MRKILISVVIPSYNGKKTIGKLLKRLEQLSENYSIEVIVIDSSSADGTLEILNLYKKRLKNFKIISIPKSSFNHGDTRNLGVKMAKGEFVCFFSQDAIPIKDNDFIKYFVEDFKTNRRVMAVFGKQIPYISTSFIQRIELERVFEVLDQFISKGKLIQDLKKPFIAFSHENKFLWYSLFDPFACYRRSYLLKNPFPRTKYGEDMILGKKIIEDNLIKIYDSRAKVNHSHKYNLAEYYRREKNDIFLRMSIGGFNIKGFPLFWKIKKIVTCQDSLIMKSNYLLELVISYFIKLFIYGEIRIGSFLSLSKYS